MVGVIFGVDLSRSSSSRVLEPPGQVDKLLFASSCGRGTSVVLIETVMMSVPSVIYCATGDMNMVLFLALLAVLASNQQKSRLSLPFKLEEALRCSWSVQTLHPT